VPLFDRLDVWKKAHVWVLNIYRFSSDFPGAERFGLTSQLRRAAASVPANLAEGQRRNSPADFAHFIDIAAGSLAEAQYFALLAHDLKYLSDEHYGMLSEDADQIEKMLTALARTLRRRIQR
jgi:four helix bundle protein